MIHKITAKTVPPIITRTRNSPPIPAAFIQRPHCLRMRAVPPITKRGESLHAESQGSQCNEMKERLESPLAGPKHLEFHFKARNKNKGRTYQRQPIQHAAEFVAANTNVSVGRQGQQPPKRCQQFCRKSRHEEAQQDCSVRHSSPRAYSARNISFSGQSSKAWSTGLRDIQSCAALCNVTTTGGSYLMAATPTFLLTRSITL